MTTHQPGRWAASGAAWLVGPRQSVLPAEAASGLVYGFWSVLGGRKQGHKMVVLVGGFGDPQRRGDTFLSLMCSL